MAHPLLEVRNLSISFPSPGGGRAVPAVHDVSFTISAKEALGLVGESGSGKSVTSLAILRLLAPAAVLEGSISFEGLDLAKLNLQDIRRVRGAKIAMIFQEPMTALNPVMRIGDQIAEAALAHGERTKAEAWRLALEALKDVAIPDHEHRARDYPHQLSGGQRQRVMIAMALVNRPQLLIADEPTTALDVTIQAQILDLLSDLREKYGLATLFISHDLGVVSKTADRVAVMYAGSIVETGGASEVFANPRMPYTQGLLNCVPTLKTDRSRPLHTIEGTVPSPRSLPRGCKFEPRCAYRVPLCAEAFPPLVEVAPQHWARCPVINADSSAMRMS